MSRLVDLLLFELRWAHPGGGKPSRVFASFCWHKKSDLFLVRQEHELTCFNRDRRIWQRTPVCHVRQCRNGGFTSRIYWSERGRVIGCQCSIIDQSFARNLSASREYSLHMSRPIHQNIRSTLGGTNSSAFSPMRVIIFLYHRGWGWTVHSQGKIVAFLRSKNTVAVAVRSPAPGDNDLWHHVGQIAFSEIFPAPNHHRSYRS